PVAVLSHGYWMRRFGGDPGAIGRTMLINNTPMTIVGVTPKEFYGVYIGRQPSLYVPLTMKAQMTPTWDRLEDRNAHYLHVLGRLKPDVTRGQAEAAMQAVFGPLLEADFAVMQGGMDPLFRDRFLHKPLLLRAAFNGVPTFREQAEAPLALLMAMVG